MAAVLPEHWPARAEKRFSRAKAEPVPLCGRHFVSMCEGQPEHRCVVVPAAPKKTAPENHFCIEPKPGIAKRWPEEEARTFFPEIPDYPVLRDTPAGSEVPAGDTA